MRFALSALALTSLLLGCQSPPTTPKGEGAGRVERRAEESRDSGAGGVSRAPDSAAASPSAVPVGVQGTIEHPAGQLPAHRLEHCGPPTGAISMTTYVPSEVNIYTFVEVEPCRDIKALLRDRCGG